jgi:hypothetical protein
LRDSALVPLNVIRIRDHSAVRKSIEAWTAGTGSLSSEAQHVIEEARRLVKRGDHQALDRVALAIVDISESMPPAKKPRKVFAGCKSQDNGVVVEAHLPRLSKRRSQEVRSAVDATLRCLGYVAEWAPRVIGGVKK